VITFGESHGPAIGAVVDGVPTGMKLTTEMIQYDLNRRRAGMSIFSSTRQENDQVEILSGVAKGYTLGSPIAFLVKNHNIRSNNYHNLNTIFRPGHADFTYYKKYSLAPQPGGGRSSGRETIGRVAAGAVARALLTTLGIHIQAYTIQIGKIKATSRDLNFAEKNFLRCPDPKTIKAMAEQIRIAQITGDSIGGIVELVATGLPIGLGEPVFGKLDGDLARAMLSIGGIKGIEIGSGFSTTFQQGSTNNDQMDTKGFLSNHTGGILGGISTGQNIILRLAIKPTPSISSSQSTQNLNGKQKIIKITGRHDPCLCPRIVPVAEAMTTLVLADAWLIQKSKKGD